MEFHKALSLFHFFNTFSFCFHHIFINDLLVPTKGYKVCSFADETTIHTIGKDIERVALNLEETV